MKNIDKLFENDIKKNQIPYNESHWEAMEALIQKEKKKKFFIYFTSAALVLTLLTIGAYYGFVSNGQTTQTALTEQLKNKRIVENTQASNIEQVAPKHPNNEKTTNSAFDKTADAAFDKPETLENPIVKQSKNGNQLEIKVIKQKDIHLHISNADVSQMNAREEIPYHNSNSENQETPIVESSVKKYLSYPKNIQPFVFDFNNGSSCITRLNMLDKLLALHPKDPNKPAKEWFLSPYINYNLFNAPVYEAKIASYKQAEQLKSTIGYGLNVKLKMGHWSFVSGLQYNTFKAVANYKVNQRYVSYDTSLKIINYDYSKTILGTRIALLKKFVDSSVTNSSSIVHPNEKIIFSYVGLPLNLQYNLGYKKFSCFVETGLLTQFLIAQKGRYVQYSGGKIDFEASSRSKSKMLLNAQFGAGLSYPVYKNISIFTSYSYITNLNSMVNGYNQKMGNNRFCFGFDVKLK